MKKIFDIRFLTLAIVISLFTLNIKAQGPGRGQMTEEDIKERSEQTSKALECDKDQQKKMLAVDMDYYNKMQIERQKMRNAGGPPPDREAMREKMRAMMDERNKLYEEILTPEQYKKFLELQEQRRNEMRQQREQRNPEGGEGERGERGRGRG